MMRRLADSLPAAVIAVGSGAVSLGIHAMPASIERALSYPLSVIWIWMLFVSCVGLVVGVWLRTPSHSERRVVGLGLELGFGFIAGGMPLVYAVAVIAANGLAVSFMASIFMFALALGFLGPWLVVLTTAMKAAKSGGGRRASAIT